MTRAYFIGSVVVEQLDRGYWRLREALEFRSATGCWVQVPAGFLTDFASCPRLLWVCFSPTDPRYSAAAFIHDRCYERNAVDRATADALLYEAAIVGGTSIVGAWCLWAGVRLGGARAYATGPQRQRERLTDYRRRGVT